MKKVLLVATSSWAGMGPYASEIINAFADDGNVFFFVVEDERRYFSSNIVQSMRKRGIILFRKNSNVNKLLDLLWPPLEVEKRLCAFCHEKQIGIIHFLTSETPYGKTMSVLKKYYGLFFTVHDLHPHEAKKAFHKMWRHRWMYRKLAKNREIIDNLLTNSRAQEQELMLMFPQKRISYFEFPSLVNNDIIKGCAIPPELGDVEDYVLFFGRIEQYKGVELAYKAFTESAVLQKYTLVIAGSGELYFPRNMEREKNIVLINRYIHDDEVAYLFRHASITLYPYISATQSGVLSLSCYFEKPIVASDVPFFKSVSEKGLGLNFSTGDLDDLVEKTMLLMGSDMEAFVQNEKRFYESHYSKESLKNKLLSIYNR